MFCMYRLCNLSNNPATIPVQGAFIPHHPPKFSTKHLRVRLPTPPCSMLSSSQLINGARATWSHACMLSWRMCRIFIGQASGKAVGVGMKQAEQKKVLTDFRAGAFNTLVATCIGEEGLDIPQACPLALPYLALPCPCLALPCPALPHLATPCKQTLCKPFSSPCSCRWT